MESVFLNSECPGLALRSATYFNVADIFTKPLDRKLFQELRAKLFGI